MKWSVGENSPNSQVSSWKSWRLIQSPPFISEYSFAVRQLVTLVNVNGKAFEDPNSNDKTIVKPQLYDPEEVLPKLKERQRKQKLQHENNSEGTVTTKEWQAWVSEGNKWKTVTATEILPSPRSYKVETERGEYRRSRRHLLRTEEPEASEFACTTPSEEDVTDTKVHLSGGGAL